MEELTESEYVDIFINLKHQVYPVCVFIFPFTNFVFNSQVTRRGEQSLAAVWSEKGQVEIFDLQSQLQAVHSSAAMAAFVKQEKEATALFSFSGHMTEGFALDWSPTVPGR